MPCRFPFGPTLLEARPSGALFWPDHNLLCVSDLHLGKSERMARRGGALLPPYEDQATLEKLEAELHATGARAVICLGDSFDDAKAADMLHVRTKDWIARLMAGRDWHWIEGNHDPAAITATRPDLQLPPLVFRHQAGDDDLEISGHFHPKVRIAGQSRRCFLTDGRRLILPAFGHYTGGLDCNDPALRGLLGLDARAILTGSRCLVIPLPAPTPRAPAPRPFRGAPG